MGRAIASEIFRSTRSHLVVAPLAFWVAIYERLLVPMKLV